MDDQRSVSAVARPLALLVTNLATLASAAFTWELAEPGPLAFGIEMRTRGFEIPSGVLLIAVSLGGIWSAGRLLLGGPPLLKWEWVLAGLQAVTLLLVVVDILLGSGPHGYDVSIRPAAWIGTAALASSVLILLSRAVGRRRPPADRTLATFEPGPMTSWAAFILGPS